MRDGIDIYAVDDMEECQETDLKVYAFIPLAFKDEYDNNKMIKALTAGLENLLDFQYKSPTL